MCANLLRLYNSYFLAYLWRVLSIGQRWQTLTRFRKVGRRKTGSLMAGVCLRDKYRPQGGPENTSGHTGLVHCPTHSRWASVGKLPVQSHPLRHRTVGLPACWALGSSRRVGRGLGAENRSLGGVGGELEGRPVGRPRVPNARSTNPGNFT